MSSPKKGCLIRAASFDLFTLWNVFVELWASHGQKPYLTQIMEEFRMGLGPTHRDEN